MTMANWTGRPCAIDVPPQRRGIRLAQDAPEQILVAGLLKHANQWGVVAQQLLGEERARSGPRASHQWAELADLPCYSSSFYVWEHSCKHQMLMTLSHPSIG